MIFDNDAAESLLEKVRSDGLDEDIAALHDIARPLIEVIARSVNNARFDDLVQEGHLKLQKVITKDTFSSGRGKLYSFLSVVIRNSMLDFVHNDTNFPDIDTVTDELLQCEDIKESLDTASVVAYMYKRYMCMYDETVLCDIVAYVVDACVEGVHEGQRGVVRTLMSEYGICRKEANALYMSAVVVVRLEMLCVAWKNNVEDAIEVASMSHYLWSVVPELVLLLGMDIALVVAILFKGVYVKL